MAEAFGADVQVTHHRLTTSIVFLIFLEPEKSQIKAWVDTLMGIHFQVCRWLVWLCPYVVKGLHVFLLVQRFNF